MATVDGFSDNNIHIGDVLITGDLEVDGDQTIDGDTVYNNDVDFKQNVTIDGDLDVKGTITSVDQLEVKDPLIKLADSNNANTFNIGFYGQYNAGFGTRYMGLIKTTTDLYNLFTNEPTEPTPSGWSPTYWGDLKLTRLLCQQATGITGTPNITCLEDSDTGLQYNSTNPNHLFTCVGNVRNFTVNTSNIVIGNFDDTKTYTLPLTRGTLNQVLKTNGAGVATWQNGNYLLLDGSTPMDDGAQILVDDGTSALPAYSFKNDNKSGIYLDFDPGVIGISTNETLQMVISTASIINNLNTIINANLALPADNDEDIRSAVIDSRSNFTPPRINLRRARNGLTTPTNGNILGNIFYEGYSTDLAAYRTASNITCRARGTWDATNFGNDVEIQADSGALGTSTIFVGYDITAAQQRIALTTTDNAADPEFEVLETSVDSKIPMRVGNQYTSAPSTAFLSSVNNNNTATQKYSSFNLMQSDSAGTIVNSDITQFNMGEIKGITSDTGSNLITQANGFRAAINTTSGNANLNIMVMRCAGLSFDNTFLICNEIKAGCFSACVTINGGEIICNESKGIEILNPDPDLTTPLNYGLYIQEQDIGSVNYDLFIENRLSVDSTELLMEIPLNMNNNPISNVSSDTSSTSFYEEFVDAAWAWDSGSPNGYTTAITCTLTIVRVGKQISLRLSTFTGTKNGTGFLLSSSTIPTRFRSSVNQYSTSVITAAGTTRGYSFYIQSNGTLRLHRDFNLTSFNDTETVTSPNITVSYNI